MTLRSRVAEQRCCCSLLPARLGPVKSSMEVQLFSRDLAQKRLLMVSSAPIPPGLRHSMECIWDAEACSEERQQNNHRAGRKVAPMAKVKVVEDIRAIKPRQVASIRRQKKRKGRGLSVEQGCSCTSLRLLKGWAVRGVTEVVIASARET